MTKKQYRCYSPEFKIEALKRASEDGVTDKDICEELGMSRRQLRRWRDQYHLMGDDVFPGLAVERDEEVAELRRQFKEAEQEAAYAVANILSGIIGYYWAKTNAHRLCERSTSHATR